MVRTSILALALVACGTSDPKPASDAEQASAEAAEQAAKAAVAEVPASHKGPFQKPIAKPELGDPAKVDLGRMLYYEPRLSKSGTISCNSCHQLDNFGVDNEPTSPGHTGERGPRNSPTVYNAGGHIAQFWDGRAATLAEQAKGPILNPIEMGMDSEDSVLDVLRGIDGYVDAFKAAFPGQDDPITYDNLAAAIEAFEKGLVTPSRFDAYLAGDATALTDAEKKGLDVYLATGCTACHMGPLLGGTMYQKLGSVEPYETADKGREEVTGNEADRYMFKVPSLRNVAKTHPYFHDGSIATLDETVRLMARHQLGRQLEDDDVQHIVTFLGALTGEPDADYIKKPELPEG